MLLMYLQRDSQDFYRVGWTRKLPIEYFKALREKVHDYEQCGVIQYRHQQYRGHEVTRLWVKWGVREFFRDIAENLVKDFDLTGIPYRFKNNGQLSLL